MSTKKIEHYTERGSTNGVGKFVFTKVCKNRMYTVNEKRDMNNVICPKCGRVLQRGE